MKLLNKFNSVIKTATGCLLISMVVIVTMQVLFRYIFKTPVAQTDELARFSMIWAAFLGSTIAVRNKTHIAVTLFAQLLPKALKKMAGLMVYVCMVVFCFLLIVPGGELALRSMSQMSPTMPLKMGYVIMVIPISGIISLIYILENIYREYVKKEISMEQNKTGRGM